MKTIGQIIHCKSFPLDIVDLNNNTLYYENAATRWCKCRYDSDGNVIYYENFAGDIEEH